MLLFCVLDQELQNMTHITQEQRYTISVLKKEGYKQKEIGERIGKDKSVISRELKRNADNRNGEYRADLAHRKAEKRKAEKAKRVNFTTSIREAVVLKLQQYYSPEQIVGEQKLLGMKCVSVERIYQHIWEDKRQGGDLYQYLRNKGRKYRKRGSNKDKRGIIADRVDIDLRPPIVEQRSRFGDLELDTIVGKDHQGGLVSINDRMTGLIKISKITAKEAVQVEDKIIVSLQEWKPLLHTLTSDNGKEFANHKSISKALEVDFYFAKPHQPWQRGSNENCNRLVRQFFPKGSDFSLVSDEEVKYVENIINNRPRKRHGFLSPIQFFNQKVAFIT
jgi:transposase, IS30 family